MANQPLDRKKLDRSWDYPEKKFAVSVVEHGDGFQNPSLFFL